MSSLRQQLLKPQTTCYANVLAKRVVDSHFLFKEVFNLIFDDDKNVSWRAAWVCHKVTEINPLIINQPESIKLINFIIPESNGSILRECLSILNQIDMNKVFSVELLNSCYMWMQSPKQPIAVKALSIKLLSKMCKIEPGLTNEFISILSSLDERSLSKGLSSVRRKIIKDFDL